MVAVTSTPTPRHAPVWRPGRLEQVEQVEQVDRTELVERVLANPPAPLPASTYRRRRAVAAGLVVGLVLALAVAMGMLGGGPLPASERPTGSPALQSGVTYVVQPGDTLWSIARRLDPHGDPRPLVDRLVAAHGGTTLHVGERLPLPPDSG